MSRLTSIERYRHDVVAFIDDELRLNELGHPLTLCPHQREVLRAAFPFQDNSRLPYDTTIYSCPKKGGKTTINAAVTLWWAFTQEPPNELLIVANDLEQAQGRVFRAVSGLLRHNPVFLRSAELQARQVLLSNGTTITAIAAEYAGAAGSNHGFTSWDEAWAYTSEAARRLCHAKVATVEPHQLEAVYDYLLKLARVRFLLADDAGAGKTIMAGLLIRELQLRGLAERILIVGPANLAFQWQRELKEKFDEKFLVLKGSDLHDQFGVNHAIVLEVRNFLEEGMKQRTLGYLVVWFVVWCMLSSATHAQRPQPALPEPTQQDNEKDAADDAQDDEARDEGEDDDEEQIKPYDQVITEEAISDDGIFTVHRLDDKVYYEIPATELGTEFLWVSHIAKTTEGVGYGGQPLGNRVVRWERRDDRVLLRSVSYGIVADPELPIAQAVDAANNAPIIKAFDIEALGEDEAPVIDVTSLFSTEVTEFSARTRLGAQGFDRQRSFVEKVLAFPTNIEVEVTHTYTAPPSSQTNRPTPAASRRGMRPGSASVVLHYSMVKLPKEPMKPRLFDERVGYFVVRQRDYGRDEHRSVERRYITRWRLEKNDPSAEVSDPVKPIVYWIDAATPRQWVPFLKAGVESWQSAFKEAGFSNAIVAREAPTREEDPEWSPEDARYSVIRWLPTTIENANGPSVHDPRTGEILEADIKFHHNVMTLVRNWYFVQVGPLDERAQDLPLPEGLMGALLQYVAAHEVGHTLGFQHNMKASSLYPLENVRDPGWVSTMGHTPTLMDYSRFNYVAQPEDGIDPADLIPKIGPYDKWATMWGYKPIPDAATPDDERPTLDSWARAQDDTPWYRFNTDGSAGADPGELTEAVGDASAVEATALGLRNLERVADMLLDATTEPGEPYDDLKEVYGRLVGQWATEMNHVAQIVGGYDSQQKHAGQDGVRFVSISQERQQEAVAFLNEHAFETPVFLIKLDILRRIEASGVLARIGSAQGRVLRSLLHSTRIVRLVEQEALDGDASYAATAFLEDLREGVWRELGAPEVDVDPYRRELHRTYLSIMNEKLNGRQPVRNDERAFVRGELRALDRALSEATDRASNRATQLHLEDARDQITRTLDPKFAPTAAAGTAGGNGLIELYNDTLRQDPSDPLTPFLCWPDYAISAEP